MIAFAVKGMTFCQNKGITKTLAIDLDLCDYLCYITLNSMGFLYPDDLADRWIEVWN